MSQVVEPTEQNQQPVPAAPATSGTTSWLKTTMAIIFYAGLTIYLGASVDHVSWFFHLYEPAGTPGDWWGMAPSYGKAGALDLTIFFLAYVAATGKTADKITTWFFTILLSAVSLYANYLYAMYYNPVHQSDIWNIQILWGWTTTGWLSPLIASSYPLYACIFMYLIERVVSRKVETPDEMRARLAALKERKAIEKEIREAEGPNFIQKAKDTVIEAKEAAKAVIKSDQPAPAPEQKTAPAAPEIAPAAAPVLLPAPADDKVKIAYDSLLENPNITDEQLAEKLNLKRPASARFWRLKAVEILATQQPASEQENLPDTEPLANVNEEVSEQESELLENAGDGDSEQDTEQEKETDTEPELTAFTTSAAPAARATRARAAKQKKRGNGIALIQKELAKNPNITNTAICKKTGLSASYVSTKRAELQPKKAEASIA